MTQKEIDTLLIYVATNSINGKQYVGLTTRTIENRIRGHLNDMIRFPNIKFYRAMRKYGYENFNFEIIEDDITDLKTLKEAEVYWIDFLDTYYNGYNSTFGGDDSPMWHSKARLKVSMAQKGRKITEETKIKLRKAAENRKGTPHTEEHKLYMSKLMKGRVRTPEHQENLRKAQLGYVQTPEHIENRVKHIRGVKKSPEHTAKLAANFAIHRYVSSGADHPRSVKVQQLDRNTLDVIMTFDTITDAAKHMGGVNKQAGISRCISGKYNNAYGYVWKKVSD